jgi:hypothetical protein
MPREFRHHVSLFLNCALAIVVAILVAARLTAEGESRTSAASARAAAPSAPAFDARTGHASRVEVSARPPALADVIAQLRALGMPNDVLARIALADFDTSWDARLAACKGDMAKSAAAQLEMDMSKDAAMRAALGEEGFRQWDQGYMLWEAMSTPVEVNAAEADTIYALKKKLQQTHHQLELARLKGTLDEAAINAGYDQAYGDYYRQLNAVLGDERYAKSQQLDDAFTSDILRHQLAPAAPSKTQFQELFKTDKAWNRSRQELDHQFRGNPNSPEYQHRLAALEEARDLEYERVLGREALAALRKSQDPAYAQMKKFETLWGLDGEKIDYVYDTMKTYDTNVARYRADVIARQAAGEPVDWNAVNQDLRRFADETQGALRERVGQAGFEKLQGNRVLRFVQVQRRPL